MTRAAKDFGWIIVTVVAVTVAAELSSDPIHLGSLIRLFVSLHKALPPKILAQTLGY